MKNWLRIAIIGLVLGFLTLGWADQECPPPVAVAPGFEYDAGQVLWPIIRAERIPLGEEWGCCLRCCDPEELAVGVIIDNGPVGMVVTPDANDAEVFRLVWTPMYLGVQYIEVSCTDTEPPDSDGVKTTRRCILLDVYRINQPPVITGCGG